MEIKEEKLKELEANVRWKVKCEEKAFHIVNRLIDVNLDEEYLIKASCLISKEHYQDVVEERSITMVCGYPVCDNQLKKASKKKYHISTKTNKVYEISERKNFCSNQCYQASKHLYNQIPESPVWARHKYPTPDIKLIPHRCIRGLVGDEVISLNPKTSLTEEVAALDELDRKTTSKQTSLKHDRKEKKAAGHEQKSEPRLREDSVKWFAANTDSESLKSIEKRDDLSIDGITKDVNALDFKSIAKSENSSKNSSSKLLSRSLHGPDEDGQKKSDDAKSIVAMASKLAISNPRNPEVLVKKTDVTEAEMGENVTPSKITSSDIETTPLFNKYNGQIDKTGHVLFQENEKVNKSLSWTQEKVSIEAKTSENGLNVEVGKQYDCADSSKTKLDYLLVLLAKRKDVLCGMVDIQTVSKDSDKSTSAAWSNELKDRCRIDTNAESNWNIYADQAKQSRLTISSKKSNLSNTKTDSALSPLEHVRNIIKKWITAHTQAYLYSSSSASQSTESGIRKPTEDPVFQRKYAQLCKRLDHQQKQFDEIINNDSEKSGNVQKAHCSVPEYDTIKKEYKDFELRVREFLTGRPLSKSEKAADNSVGVYLPSIDSRDQMAIRARIVLDRLEKSLKSLLPPLSLSMKDISEQLRELAYTFRLDKDTIVFRPSEWTLVAMFILKMLSLKFEFLKKAFLEDGAARYFGAMIAAVGHSIEDLEDMTWNLIFS